MNLDKAKVDMLLNLASKKLGLPADELRRRIEGGELSKIDPRFQNIDSILNTPGAVEKIMSSKEAGEIIASLKKE